MVKVGQHMAGEQVGFGGVRVAGQDESVHAEVRVGADLGQHLIGIADDGRASARARAADAGPQVRFGVAVVIGDVAELVLPLGSRGAGVQGPAADGVAGAVIEPGNEALRGGC